MVWWCCAFAHSACGWSSQWEETMYGARFLPARQNPTLLRWKLVLSFRDSVWYALLSLLYDGSAAHIHISLTVPQAQAGSSGHRLIWWEGMRCRFAMNPMLHRTILRKSITFAYVHLRENKSKLGLRRSLSEKTGQTLTLHRCGTNKQYGT